MLKTDSALKVVGKDLETLYYAWGGSTRLQWEDCVPQEFRQLVFTEKEVIEALSQHCVRMNRSLPEGSAVKCNLTSKPEIAVELVIQNVSEGRADTGTHASVALEAAFVGAALLRFCMDKKIPIPRKGQKALQIADSALLLTITL